MQCSVLLSRAGRKLLLLLLLVLVRVDIDRSVAMSSKHKQAPR